MNKRGFLKSASLLGIVAALSCLSVNAAELNLPIVKSATNATYNYSGGTADASGGTNFNVNVTGSVADIDYDSFSVGSGNTVDFNFSSAGQVALNRVTGGNPSIILGNITNSGEAGKVFLINQSGVLFGSNSSVNLNSFMVTTHNVSSSYLTDVPSSKLLLEGASNNGIKIDSGSIFNIDNSLGIYSNNIIQNGTINAGGVVSLVSSDGINFTWTDDSITSISAGSTFTASGYDPDSAVFYGEDGNVDSSVDTNGSALSLTGIINASQVSAMAKYNVEADLTNLVNLNGVIFADSTLGADNGNIFIYGENINTSYDGGIVIGGSVKTPNGYITVNNVNSNNHGSMLEILDDTVMVSGGTGAFRLDVNDSTTQSGDIVIGDNVTLETGGILKMYTGGSGSGSAGNITIGDNANFTAASDIQIWANNGEGGNGADITIGDGATFNSSGQVSLSSSAALNSASYYSVSGDIEIGDNFTVKAPGSVKFNSWSYDEAGKITIGNNLYIDSDSNVNFTAPSYLNTAGGIEVGDNAYINADSYILLSAYSHWYSGGDSSVVSSIIFGDDATLISGDYINFNNSNYRFTPGDLIFGDNTSVTAVNDITIGGYSSYYGNEWAGLLSIGADTDITSTAGSITINNYTYNDGDGGIINIGANTALDAASNISVFSNAYGSGTGTGSGDGGTVNISEGATLNAGGNIYFSANAMGAGNGGTINVADNVQMNSNKITLDVKASLTGNGGSLNIGDNNLYSAANDVLFYANAYANGDGSGSGNGGNVAIGNYNNFTAGNDICLQVEARGDGNGGDLEIGNNNSFDATNDLNLYAEAHGDGDGGNITVFNNTTLLADNSVNMMAEAEGAGNGGNITLSNSNSIISYDVQLNAAAYTTGDGGTVNIGNNNSIIADDKIRLIAQSVSGAAGSINIGYDTVSGNYLTLNSGGNFYAYGPMNFKNSIDKFNLTAGGFTIDVQSGAPTVYLEDTDGVLQLSSTFVDSLGEGSIVIDAKNYGAVMLDDISVSKNIVLLLDSSSDFDSDGYTLSPNSKQFALDNSFVASNGGSSFIARTNGKFVASGYFDEGYKDAVIIKNNGELTTLYEAFPECFLSHVLVENDNVSGAVSGIDPSDYSKIYEIGKNSGDDDSGVLDIEVSDDNSSAKLSPNSNKTIRCKDYKAVSDVLVTNLKKKNMVSEIRFER